MNHKFPIIALLLLFCSCADIEQPVSENPFSGPNPWPEIREERIQTLLPEALQRAGVDAWAIICRSNNNEIGRAHV